MANLFELPQYIAIEGPIRVGKTTLAANLSEKMRAQRLTEPEDNAFLAPFYEGDAGAAFQTQFAFLIARFEQLRALPPKAGSPPLVVDYIFEKDKIFAYLNLNDAELAVYDRYYNEFRRQLRTPDLVIYLQASAETCKKRLRQKNVPAERRISDDYIEQVVKAYEHFFFHYTASDLLVVDTNDIDFVHRAADLKELFRRLAEPIKGTQYYLPLLGDGVEG